MFTFINRNKFFVLSLFLVLVSSCVYAQTTTITPEEKFIKKYNKFYWQQIYYGKIDGSKKLMFSHSMASAKLSFADLDSDGDKDAIMGFRNGRLGYWENKGTNKVPNFELITDSFKGYFFERGKDSKQRRIKKIIQLPLNAVPAFMDIDGDQDLDLLVGNHDGTIWLFENRGNNLIPLYYLVTKKLMDIDVKQNSAPIVRDMDIDGKADLIIGDAKGEIWFYKNQGTVVFPRFDQKTRKLVGVVPLNTNAVPQALDWNKDGFVDLIVGTQDGTLVYYENKANIDELDWKTPKVNFNFLDVGGNAGPVFSDLDASKTPDLIVTSTQPIVQYYQMRQDENDTMFWSISDNFFSYYKLILRGNKAMPAFGDVDGDGDTDAIIGEEDGNLNYYINKAKTKGELNWHLETENLLNIKHSYNSAPALGDLDGDGDLDLLIGQADGSIYYAKNIGTPKKPHWELQDTTFFQIDVGNNAVPRLVDIDGDGDLDLLVGSLMGSVVLYENTGSKTKPFFVLTNPKFAKLTGVSDVVPSFFDWNNDGKKDMILGNSKGSLQILFGASKYNSMSNWDPNSFFTIYLDPGTYSAPLFYDLDQDGLQDLIIGNGDGDILFFKNLGTTSADQNRYLIDNSIDVEDGSLVVYQKDHILKISRPVGDKEKKVIKGSEVSQVKPHYHLDYTEEKKAPVYESKGKQLVYNKNLLNAAPTLADIDGDKDLDMLVGTRDGKLFFFSNEGDDKNPKFRSSTFINIKLKDKENVTPIFADIDKDGDYDLILGSKQGAITVYRNDGTREKPLFVEQKKWTKDIWLYKNTHPAVWDFNKDGYPDLLVGSVWGRMSLLLNRVNHFKLIQKDFQAIDVGHNASPFIGIPDNGGKPYLLIGTDKGKVLFYQNTGEDLLKGKWKLSSLGSNIQLQKSVKPVLADIDKDGDQDLIIGTEREGVLLFKNQAQKPKTDKEIQDYIQKEAVE